MTRDYILFSYLFYICQYRITFNTQLLMPEFIAHVLTFQRFIISSCVILSFGKILICINEPTWSCVGLPCIQTGQKKLMRMSSSYSHSCDIFISERDSSTQATVPWKFLRNNNEWYSAYHLKYPTCVFLYVTVILLSSEVSSCSLIKRMMNDLLFARRLVRREKHNEVTVKAKEKIERWKKLKIIVSIISSLE